MARKIQIMRGVKANLPTLDIGEFAYCYDTDELYVGSVNGNQWIPIEREIIDCGTFTNAEYDVLFDGGNW